MKKYVNNEILIDVDDIIELLDEEYLLKRMV